MDQRINTEDIASTGIIPQRLASRATRSDFLYRPDSWVNGMVSDVEELLEKVVSTEDSLISPMGRHILFGYAKRLRPLFVLLAQHLFTDSSLHGTKECAAAAELIHCATLFHDDVIDKSDTRRGKSSANALWGNKQAVIAGDHFFVLAYQMLLELRDFYIFKLYVDMCRSLAEGILSEIKHTDDLDVTVEIHVDIITRKTAVFFISTALAGGYIGKAPDEFTSDLAGFGLNFGLAFQLMDDLLDLFSPPEATGKPRGSDLKSGIYTVPVIYGLQHNPDFRNRFIPILKSGEITQDDVDEIGQAIKVNGAGDYARSMMLMHGEKALSHLDRLPDGRASETFRNLLVSVISRPL